MSDKKSPRDTSAQNANPRETAVKALMQMGKGGRFSDALLSETLDFAQMSGVNKRFCANLFYGVIERKLTLDEIIRSYSKIPLIKLDPEIKNILRTGLYQLLYMNSVPDNAAVDEAVKLCAAFKKTSGKGFVNALLRQFLRDSKRIPNIDNFSVKYSINPDIYDSFKSDYGEKKANEILESFFRTDVTYIRLNSRRFTKDNLPENFSETDIPNVFSGGNPGINSSEFKAGVYHIQDYSCAYALNLMEIRGGEDILDVCAAPGGKSFTLAEMTSGSVYACDISAKRLAKVEDGIKRLGLSNIKTFLHDGKVFDESFPKFSRILCDVPCSGLGVIRKKPEIRYKNVSDFSHLPEVQYDILENSVRYLADGGVLLYSTCTLKKAENEDVIARFLENHNDFPKSMIEMRTIFPGDFNSDGFFIAKLKAVK
ncbi:MAG: 16S rRNA (cytosine(967)-C(5))-methyltransferase RsmB [Ruminococcus sp.]|jgi:16S rRNA (cytosine967-C5)-methyltransferase|nr:16S rRNA (cytosine(967)-C(5))-methyltransferase RsmB [Ruminococcus sp.]